MRRRRRPANASGPPSFFVAPVGEGPSAEGPTVPDVLHAEPRRWPDLRGSAELVRFAFEGGDCAGLFEQVVKAMPLAPTDLAAESFASQLFLDELVQSCFAFAIDGQRFAPDRTALRRVLVAPSADAADRKTRQAVLRELVEKPTFRSDLERLYLAVRKLRTLLESGAAAEANVARRKIQVLVALRQAVDALADGFAGSGSALARLRAVGENVRATEAWPHLVSLVDLDGNVATVDVRLKLGADGQTRGFDVLAVRENSQNPFWPSPLARLWQRLTARLRGHRYGEQEIVGRLLEGAFAPWIDDVVAMVALAPSLEVYLGALGFRGLAAERGLATCLAEVEPKLGDGAARVVRGLFNPLLLLQTTPRAIDLPVQRADSIVILTGPNSGGKTRLLQALALTQLLGQGGLFVPASEARLTHAPRLVLSLGAEENAGQVEGRLGTELVRVRRIFEALEPGGLAILDELCSGTNPLEGEQLFETVVSLLPRLRPQAFVSTHFLGLAARLERAAAGEGTTFLQVELDADEKPTYRFVPGVATTSLAHKVAARLGVTREALEALIAEKSR